MTPRHPEDELVVFPQPMNEKYAQVKLDIISPGIGVFFGWRWLEGMDIFNHFFFNNVRMTILHRHFCV